LPPEAELDVNNKLDHNRMLSVCGLDLTGSNSVGYMDYVKIVIKIWVLKKVSYLDILSYYWLQITPIRLPIL
jgi:hypothetical protein